MRVITEADLRANLARDGRRQIHVDRRDVLTPSARDYIREQGLEVVVRENQGEYQVMSWRSLPSTEDYTDELGNLYEVKPEHMTHLRGRLLVPKSHPRIVFRGKMDTLQAVILQTQITALGEGNSVLVDDLEELLIYARSILGAEVRRIPLESTTLFNLSDEKLREVSHDPKFHFGVEHFLVSRKMGAVMVALNLLRTQVRETELAAVVAFRDKDEGRDIIRALNRMSSGVYILMCRTLSQYCSGEDR